MSDKFGWEKANMKRVGERAVRERREERRERKKHIPVVMPFGMYRGQKIDDLPDQYLEWVLGLDIGPYLRTALQGVQMNRLLAKGEKRG